ncbi:MAG: hypothetical protein RSB90_07365 [Eubacterium sp.]
MNNELQFLIYNTPEEDISVNAVVKDETIWLTQKAMAELFDVGVPAISKHLKNIFAENELDEKVVVSISEKTTQHGAIEGKTQTKGEKMLNEKSLILRFEKSGLPCLDVNAESMKEAEAMVNLIVYIMGKSPKSTGDYIEDVECTLNILKEEYNDPTK